MKLIKFDYNYEITSKMLLPDITYLYLDFFINFDD